MSFLTQRHSPILWGAYTGNTPSTLADFEKKVGKAVNLQAVFVGWEKVNGSFPSKYKSSVADQGKTLVIFWEPYGTTLDNIISSSHDEYIQQWAADAKAYGGPIILIPFHEMNGNWVSWNGTTEQNSAEKIIAAWRHMHGFFSTNTNVEFGWAVNNISVPDVESNQIEYYYPGDEYVDYVGVDGFNFGDPWMTFNEIFADVLKRLKAYKKPVFIFSMASAEGPQKAAWITDALTQIKKDPRIKGFIWFNQNKEQNWLIDSSAASLSAFQAALE